MSRIAPLFTLLLVLAAAPIIGSTAAMAQDAPQVKITDIEVGTGDVAELGNRVKVHYTGWLMDGTKFDSSRTSDSPFEFSLGAHEVIRGWDIGIQGMKVGGKRELIIPSELAYGKKGRPDAIPPNATLKFEVELLDTFANRVTHINNDELADLIKRGVPVIDLRRPDEIKEKGMIEGSKVITGFLEMQRFSPDFLRTLKATVDKTDEFIMICSNGRRSTYLSRVLADRKGYTNIYNVKYGIDKWIEEGRPVVKP